MVVSQNIVEAGRGVQAPSAVAKERPQEPRAFQDSLHASLQTMRDDASSTKAAKVPDAPSAASHRVDASSIGEMDVNASAKAETSEVKDAADGVVDTAALMAKLEQGGMATGADRKKATSSKDDVAGGKSVRESFREKDKKVCGDAVSQSRVVSDAQSVAADMPAVVAHAVEKPEAFGKLDVKPEPAQRVGHSAATKAKSVAVQEKDAGRSTKEAASVEQAPLAGVEHMEPLGHAEPAVAAAEMREGSLKPVSAPGPHKAMESAPSISAALERASFTQSLGVHAVREVGDQRQGIEVTVPGQGSEQVQLRAVVDQDGKVHATVTTQTEASHHVLEGAVQSITTFLEAERVRVDSITVAHTQMESGFNFGDSGRSAMSQQQQQQRDDSPQNAGAGMTLGESGHVGRLSKSISGTPAASAAWGQLDSYRTLSVRA